jgi:hypothetical protein
MKLARFLRLKLTQFLMAVQLDDLGESYDDVGK